MVFVHQVVTVHGIAPEEIAETEEKVQRVVEFDPHHVLSGCLNLRWRRPVNGQYLKFLEIDVYRMLPATRAVYQYPVLHGILSDLESSRIAIDELPIDGPHLVGSLEIEGPGYNRRGRRARQVVKLGDSRRV